MKKNERKILVITAILSLLVSALPAKQLRQPRGTILVPGQTAQARLPVIENDGGSVEFELTIPEDAFFMSLEITDSPADLDLFLTDSGDELYAYSELTDFNEVLYLSRMGDVPLTPGRYIVEVTYQYSRPPMVDGNRLTEIPFSLTAHISRLHVNGRLSPGNTIDGILRPEEGMAQVYELSVPTGTSTLRLDISDTDGDLDLFVSRDEIPTEPFEADYWEQTVRSTEVLIMDRESIPALRPGTYYVLIVDQVAADYPIPFTLTISDSSEAPATLRSIPDLPKPNSPLENAVLATVELVTDNSGGSGCLISPEGHILTNYHVVRDDSGRAADIVTVGFSLENARPPVELYSAEVIRADKERDLALLRITSGRYGSLLTGNVEFPYIEIGGSSTHIGESLQFIGYPWIGGTGSRASVTYSTGVIAGYQAMPYGYLIKTDAEINEGNSGGAALNSNLELIGMPTQIVHTDGGQIAYIVPVNLIPEEWLRILP